jgi:hypothetical protein
MTFYLWISFTWPVFLGCIVSGLTNFNEHFLIEFSYDKCTLLSSSLRLLHKQKLLPSNELKTRLAAYRIQFLEILN